MSRSKLCIYHLNVKYIFKTYPITYQVNSWDRMIFENGESIVNLNEDVEKVKADQTVSNKPQEPT